MNDKELEEKAAMYKRLARFFSMLANPARLKILQYLKDDDERDKEKEKVA